MSVVSEDQILQYINQARTSPKKFAKYIQQEIDQFINHSTLPLYPGCNYATHQGKGAWIECKQVLDNMQPVHPFKLSKALCLAAEDHAADLAAHNMSGHKGSDGSNMETRIFRRGQKVLPYRVAENVGGDFKVKGRNHALNAVKSLLIDDGVSSRGHRKTLLSTQYQYIGIGSRVAGDKITVVMDFLNYDPALKNSDAPSNAGNQIDYNQTNSGGQHKGGNFDNFGGGGFGQIQKGGHYGGNQNQGGNRYPVNTSTKTSTQTVNGRTTKKTITTITYSDGSVETNQQISQNY